MKCILIVVALVFLAPPLLLLLARGTAAAAAARVIEGGPDPLSSTRSLAQAIDQAHGDGRTLHILFVHGIRAEGPGASQPFTTRLAYALGDAVISRSRRLPLTLSPWPQDATMSGKPNPESPLARTPIWKTRQDWDRSQPFIERTVIAAPSGSVMVDEVNYWPLLFPLKCRFLLQREHDLAGSDTAHLKLCAAQGWLTPTELANLLKKPPRSGGGAYANRRLKQEILDWGLSDAVIALGPMRHYLNDMIDKACAQAIEAGPRDRYVVVSESLGSFVVLDALAERRGSVAALLDRTADLYFFANQFQLLELARIEGIPPATAITPSTVGSPPTVPAGMAPPSPLEALVAWARKDTVTAQAAPGAVAGLEKQVVAFSDPSDLLTFNVPPLKDVRVVNLYDRQGFNLFGLLANPIRAHTGHVDNPAVWKVLMRRQIP